MTNKPPLRILHLEDDPLDAELVRARLEADGLDCDVLWVDNGSDFVSALERRGFDVILADYSLPSFDGASALRLALQKCPQVPYIFVSGNIGEEYAVETLKNGATDYVLKDRLSRLSASVLRALNEAQERSARLKAETEARELGEKLRSLVDESPMGAVIIQDRRFIYVNRSFREISGYSEDELYALQDVLDLVHSADRDPIRDKVLKVLKGERGSAQMEVRGVRKDGGLVDVELFGSHTAYLGREAVIVSVVDITGRKRLEQQKKDFYAMVTHDLKSPLTAIIGYTDIMLTIAPKRLDAETKEMVSSIDKNSTRLLGMVEDFLALSRLEEAAPRLNLVSTSVEMILHEAQNDVKEAVQEKGLTLEAGTSQIVPDINIDPRLVLRAVGNLLQNAVNYTPVGGRVTLAATLKAGEVEVSVSDTGPGIPHEDQVKVFDKYYRSAATSFIKGTGLGLAIVKAVAEAHGGRVELASEPGKGSTFRFILPTGHMPD